jgi:CubicO group peptidase (beta-lactamase class C family)
VQVPPDLAWAQPESEIDGRGCYGFNWWVNGITPTGRRKWPEAPSGTFAALGHNNNRLVIIPEWRVVIVRLGLDQKDRKLTDEALNGFIRRLGDSLQD